MQSKSPETDLFVAILMQAYRDLVTPVTKTGVSQIERDKSLSLLTDRTGPYAVHRRNLCDLIGWDEEAFRKRNTGMLNGTEEFPNLNGEPTPAIKERHERGVAEIRQEWVARRNRIKWPTKLLAGAIVAEQRLATRCN